MSDDDEQVDFFGLPVTLTSMEKCAQADYLVCCTADTPSPFPDNRLAQCAICAVPIIYRPYMPPGPKKVCIDCFTHLAGGQATK